MAQVTIHINGREYAIACGNGEEGHIVELSKILDDKAKLLTQNGAQINENQLLAMIGLLVADELQDAKAGKVTSEVKTEIVEKIVEVPVEKIVEKTVEVPVEKIVEVEKNTSSDIDLSELDADISGSINEIVNKINMLANDIKTW